MIHDRLALREALFGLVGFYDTSNPDYPSLTPSLLTSRSGRRVNDVHELLSDVENVDQSKKNFSKYNYPDWLVGTEYAQGDKVVEAGLNYEYSNPLPSAGNLVADNQYWTEIDELSDYLIKVVYSGIDKFIDDWINDKKADQVVKSIWGNVLLFSGTANYRDVVSNSGEVVGLKLRLKRGERSVVSIVNKIGHHFSANVEGLTVYLFHSSQKQPLAEFEINHTKETSQEWTSLAANNILRYLSDDHEAGGDFYVCYKQDDLEALGGQALKMRVGWRETPCGDCGSKWADYYKQYSGIIDVVGFSVSALGAGDTLFDPDDVSENLTNNYGLNLNLTTKCDIGYLLAQEEELLAQGVNYAVGLKLLQGMASTVRGSNQVASQVRGEAKKELYNHKGAWGTVFDHYSKAVKSTRVDFSGMSELCLPCDNGFEPIAGMGTIS